MIVKKSINKVNLRKISTNNVIIKIKILRQFKLTSKDKILLKMQSFKSIILKDCYINKHLIKKSINIAYLNKKSKEVK